MGGNRTEEFPLLVFSLEKLLILLECCIPRHILHVDGD